MKCTHYRRVPRGHSRCANSATVHLYAPDGAPCPGARLCRQCADEVIAEYSGKLGEVWTTKPIDEYGDLK